MYYSFMVSVTGDCLQITPRPIEYRIPGLWKPRIYPLSLIEVFKRNCTVVTVESASNLYVSRSS